MGGGWGLCVVWGCVWLCAWVCVCGCVCVCVCVGRGVLVGAFVRVGVQARGLVPGVACAA